jgi:HK97 family phage prohead protease
MMQTRDRKATLIRAEKADDATGVVEAIVNTFDVVDSYNTRLVYGAFDAIDAANSPEEDTLPSVVWSHDFQRFAGKGVEFRQLKPGDESLPAKGREHGGLYAKVAFALETIDGKDLYEHVKFGSVRQWSFGFDILESTGNSDGVLDITKVDTFEVSPVLLGANPITATLTARGYDRMTLRQKMQAMDTLLASLDGHVRSYIAMRMKEGRPFDASFITELERMAVRAGELTTETRRQAQRTQAQRELQDLKRELLIG